MTDPDFNLLAALDVLLSEKSVAGAAYGRSPATRYWSEPGETWC